MRAISVGFVISLLLHSTVITSVLWTLPRYQTPQNKLLSLVLLHPPQQVDKTTPVPAANSPAPKSKPEAQPESKPAPKLITKPQPKPQSRPVSKSQPDFKPAPEPIPEPQPEPKPAPRPAPKPQAKPKLPLESTRVPVLKAKPDAIQKPASEVTPIQTSPSTPAPLSTQVDIRAEKAYINAVRDLIEKNNTYPRKAKRRRIQGEVIVRFTLSANGVVTHRNVHKTSGFSVLDQAALSAVTKVRRFPPFPKHTQRTQWVFTIPLRYALK